jgi:chromate reductase
MKILGVCGSLRTQSYNLFLLKELFTKLSRENECKIYSRLADIPPFQPDIPCPEAVATLRADITSADAIVIASPEYVHGIPGALKNALDWIVGTGEWDQKPTAILNVTPSANEPVFVRDGLKEVIQVMSGGHVLGSASFTVTSAFKKFDASGRITDDLLLERLDRTAAEIRSIRNDPDRQ